MRAIGYVRVSTEGQAEEGVSLEAQRGKLEAWAKLSDFELVAVHVDAGISGCRADNRPGLQAALDDACEQKAVLVVYSLSRLARSTRDAIDIAERLDKAGADLCSLSEKIDTTSAAGKMLFRLMAVLAEFERDQIAERTSTALQHKKAKGELVGSVPYGYQLAADGTHLEPCETEQIIIAAAKSYHAAGMGLREISRRLAADGYTLRGSSTLHHMTVKRLLAVGEAA